mgnify:CR=1
MASNQNKEGIFMNKMNQRILPFIAQLLTQNDKKRYFSIDRNNYISNNN